MAEELLRTELSDATASLTSQIHAEAEAAKHAAAVEVGALRAEVVQKQQAADEQLEGLTEKVRIARVAQAS